MILLRNSELSACFREVVLAVSFVAQNSAESCIYRPICLSKQLHDVVAAVLIVKTQKWADNVTENKWTKYRNSRQNLFSSGRIRYTTHSSV